MHLNHLWNTWSNLTQVVKTGISAHRAEINERGEEWLFPFINAMHDRAKKQAPEQLANIDLSGIKSILDIGGGSGAYSMHFVFIKPEIAATVFDLPNVVPITKIFLEKEGFTDKIKTHAGDYTKDDLPKGLINLTRYLSKIFADKNINVNCISPGGLFNNQPERFLENYCKKVPLRRMANNDDIKGLVVLLASKAGAYINGENILMDGGLNS